MFSIGLIAEAAHAPSGRLDQLVKDTQIVSGSAFKTIKQKISCDDISGHIEKLAVSLSGQPASGNFLDARASFSNGTRTYVSDTRTLFKEVQKDYTFTFDPAVDVDTDLCANGGVVDLGITLNQPVAGLIYAYGSATDTYLGGYATDAESPNTPVQGDLYFIINGIAEVNHPPILSPVGNFMATEGSVMSFKMTSHDQDQVAKQTYSINNIPEHATLVGDTFRWTPGFDQSGIYEMEVIVTDAGNASLLASTSSELVTITVQDTSPILNRLDQLVKDTQIVSGSAFKTIKQKISCDDISGHIEKLAVSLSGQPASGNFLDARASFSNGTRTYVSDTRTLFKEVQKDYTFTFDPAVDVDTDLCANGGVVDLGITLNQPVAGLIYAYGSATDTYLGGYATDAESPNTPVQGDLYFIINPHAQSNLAPALSAISAQTVTEAQSITFIVSATDPDNDAITLGATNLPTGATFNPTTGEFDWTPSYSAAGTYQVTFTATENTPEALSDSETITVTVNNRNRAPELTPIGNQLINEGDTVQFNISATDADNDGITLSASDLPAGATFTPSTGLFSWNTDFDDAGNYPDIEFTATDNGIPMELDVELITITVGDVNRMPEVTNPGPQEVLEEDTLSFNVSATDPDGDIITLSASNLPNGASFNPTTGTFTWTPSLSDAGVYTVTITATDNGLPVESASTEVVITVGDNPTPIEQAEDLVEEVITIDIPQNVENSYLANLQKVGQFILEGKITAAINQLNAFVVKITKDYQKGILTQVQYQSLLTAANDLIGDLTNG